MTDAADFFRSRLDQMIDLPPLSRLMSPPSNWRILKSGGSIEVRDVEILEGEAGARAVADGTAEQPVGRRDVGSDRGAGGHAVPMA